MDSAFQAGFMYTLQPMRLKKSAGGCDGSVIVFQTPYLCVVVRDVLLNYCNVFLKMSPVCIVGIARKIHIFLMCRHTLSEKCDHVMGYYKNVLSGTDLC